MTNPVFWDPHWTAALVNHLWQSTVVLAAAWLLTLVLRRNHARVRYWVWMTASLKFLVPFSMLIAAGEWVRSVGAAPVVARPAIVAVMQQIEQPFTEIRTPGVAVATLVVKHTAAAAPGGVGVRHIGDCCALGWRMAAPPRCFAHGAAYRSGG